MLSLLATDPPIDPGTEEGRGWLQRELTKAEYNEPVSLLQQLTRWVNDLFNEVAGNAAASGTTLSKLMILVLILGVGVLLGWFLPRIRRERSAAGPRDGGVLDEVGLSARDYRDRAQQALAGTRWDAALLDSYRAIATDSSERTLLDDVPGRTAHEIALALGRPFPDRGQQLVDAADQFDGVRYGGAHASEAEARGMQALDREVARARPRHDAGTPPDRSPALPDAGGRR